jgi:Zn-dependent peptidase ImmA (M78 family)
MKKNEFKLAGMTWEIIESDMPDLGASNPDNCKIMINSRLKGQEREVTFYHELVHAILFTMGERDHDERFVEGFAQLLYQYEQQKV